MSALPQIEIAEATGEAAALLTQVRKNAGTDNEFPSSRRTMTKALSTPGSPGYRPLAVLSEYCCSSAP
jgi:hypothetical protein